MRYLITIEIDAPSPIAAVNELIQGRLELPSVIDVVDADSGREWHVDRNQESAFTTVQS